MQPPEIKQEQPARWLLGLDTLYHIKHNALNYYTSLHQKYGDAVLVQLGPYRCWFLFHPMHIEQVLAKQADKFIRFRKIMNILRQWNGESLLISEGASWKERRRKVLPAFKRDRMPEYAKMVLEQADELYNNITQHIDKYGSYSCDIDLIMAQHALDIAGITLFGRRLGSESQTISQAVHDLSEIAYKETVSPFVIPSFIPTPFNLHKRSVIKTIKHAIRDIVNERFNSPAQDYGDLLSILIEHHQNEFTAIEEDVMSLLIAGHETSGATLSWLFLLLAKNPEDLKRLHTELDTVLGGKAVEFEDLKRLPYLIAVIQETMRLFPAPYALFCREATEDIDLERIQIKKGDLVQLLPYVTHRDERWFKKASSFSPDRFLNDMDHPQYAYFPFGAGPRVCIGQSFGMMEVALTTASILQKITLEYSDKELLASPRFSLRPDKNIFIRFLKR